MQHADMIITGWLNGSDTVNGMDNPAGPLYIDGQDATEAVLSNARLGLGTRCSVCTASAGSQCC